MELPNRGIPEQSVLQSRFPSTTLAVCAVLSWRYQHLVLNNTWSMADSDFLVEEQMLVVQISWFGSGALMMQGLYQGFQ